MKVFPKGTPKLLLINAAEVQRNAERTKPGGPVVIVAVENGKGGHDFFEGYDVHADGPVTLAVDQRNHVCVLKNREKVRAAYVTTGEVRLAQVRFEDLTKKPAPLKPTTPTTDKAPN